MLRDKHRMVMPRRLLAIIQRRGRSQPLVYEIRRVVEDNCQPLAVEVIKLSPLQADAAAEG